MPFGVGSVKITTNQPGTVVLNGISQSIVNTPYETIFTNLPSGYHTATFLAANRLFCYNLIQHCESKL